jgi:hypothetical protein
VLLGETAAFQALKSNPIQGERAVLPRSEKFKRLLLGGTKAYLLFPNLGHFDLAETVLSDLGPDHTPGVDTSPPL